MFTFVGEKVHEQFDPIGSIKMQRYEAVACNCTSENLERSSRIFPIPRTELNSCITIYPLFFMNLDLRKNI